jgi:hypothetical protein
MVIETNEIIIVDTQLATLSTLDTIQIGTTYESKEVIFKLMEENKQLE